MILSHTRRREDSILPPSLDLREMNKSSFRRPYHMCVSVCVMCVCVCVCVCVYVLVYMNMGAMGEWSTLSSALKNRVYVCFSCVCTGASHLRRRTKRLYVFVCTGVVNMDCTNFSVLPGRAIYVYACVCVCVCILCACYVYLVHGCVFARLCSLLLRRAELGHYAACNGYFGHLPGACIRGLRLCALSVSAALNNPRCLVSSRSERCLCGRGSGPARAASACCCVQWCHLPQRPGVGLCRG